MDYKELLDLEVEKNKALLKIITHDLANPVSVINTYLELLQMGKIPEDQHLDILEKIRANTLAAMEIIRSTRKHYKSSESK